MPASSRNGHRKPGRRQTRIRHAASPATPATLRRHLWPGNRPQKPATAPYAAQTGHDHESGGVRAAAL